MLNNSPVFEKLLEIHNISFDAGKKLSKKIISRYTSIDKYGELAISFADKFYETPITIDKNFLRDELRYKWSRLGNYDNLFGDLIDLMIDELGFEYDFSVFFIFNFLFPEIYDVYFKFFESDNIIESINRN